MLKAGATVVTVGATVASALFVTAHLKNPVAPLQPTVLSAKNGASTNELGGSVTIAPSVQPSSNQPVTSTYAS